MTRAHDTQSDGLTDRMLGLLAVTLCLLLAGCAGSGTHRDADADTLDPADLALASLSKDPIGALVSAQRRQAIGNPMISEALDQLGIRYRYGGTSPDTGFDCSGLVFYSAERALGLTLPRNSSSMALVGTAIDKHQLEPGDLVFFNTLGRRYSHVGIYLGDDRFVHAPSSRGVVRIEKITLAYWAKRYNGARRLEGDLLVSASQH